MIGGEGLDFKRGINTLKLEPARVLVLGIAIIVTLGALLLNLPIASKDGLSIGFIDALFTATSAVSVTGLVVVNTSEHWTLFGQIVILLLIQAGGLGFMTLATLISLILGKKIGLRDRLIIQEQLNQFNLSGVVRLIKYVIKVTFAFEFIGAVLLATRFIPIYGIAKGLYYSVFHSISAFCNAGFDLTGSSMELFADDFVVIMTVSALVIFGGIGYTVFMDIYKNKKLKRTSLHTKMVLKVNLFLLIVGFLFFILSEYSNSATIAQFDTLGKFLSSVFQSVVPRTAGFNSVDMGALRPATALFFIILMFIGGSPSSTAGGIKTTTFGVLMVTIVSVIKGKDEVDVMKKRIPNSIVYRAFAIAVISLSLIIVMTMVLTFTEGFDFLDILFEVTSAFATVGLSRGITSELTQHGRLIVAGIMFVGKVGPLTMALALARRHKNYEGKYKYPKDKLMVG